MPRRKPQRAQPAERPLRSDSTARIELGPSGFGDNDHIVRQVPGSRATKAYRCPGCDHEIAPGVAHVVAWPVNEIGGVQDRRHWHTGCWSGRQTRGVTRRWS
ncbi:ATP/GTP-binding protein [Antrihabitans sp. YC2-6]|uniref:ATP/GTP-binding protein n=1 Tax=Antrihabitans sp. YC2-6 TaxID=2799498 RepID=UPI0018F3C849|nr:ATP/GTP-binding protein [Antrihabitans sp. YC2-6]MBJ8346591.1 ATP/GTP-binding protein [Antrihabitans sp. YC2-6]